MERSVIKASVLLVLVFLTGFCSAQQRLLDQPITLEVYKLPLGKVLAQLEVDAKVNFSFNSKNIPTDSVVSVNVKQLRLRNVLLGLLGEETTLRESGRHIIIIREGSTKKTKKHEYVISGYIRGTRTGDVIPKASVYHVGKGTAVLTDAKGYYQIPVETRTPEYTSISYRRRDYLDTKTWIRL